MAWNENRTSMTEVELLARYMDLMKQAEDCCRGLAHSRKDERWLKLARLHDEIRNKTILLANRSIRAAS